MAYLRALGGLWLENGDEADLGRASQRRRLALLVLLALAPDRRLTRDKVLALLWPEATELEGRRRLSASIYYLRQALGGDVIESAGDQLCLDSALHSDVEHFEAAVAKRDWALAESLYTGPLLDGVHLPDTLEFDEWLTLQRERLRRLHVHVCEKALADRLAARDSAGTISAARRLLDAEPLGGRTAAIAVEAIAAAGDRTQAVRAGQAHVQQVRAELGSEPEETLVRLLERLRAPAPSSLSTAPTFAAVPSPGQPSSDEQVESGAVVDPPASVRRVTGRSLRAYAPVSVAAFILVVGLAATTRWERFRASPAAPSRESRGSTFATIRIESDSATPVAMRDAVSNRLTAALAELGATDSVIRRELLGIPREASLTGRLSSRDARVQLDLTLRDGSADATIASVQVGAPAPAMSSRANAIARELVAAALENNAQHLAAAATRSTESLAAVAAFLSGEQSYRLGRYADALRSFRTAVERDSSFALAYYRLALCALWDEQPLAAVARDDSLLRVNAPRLAQDERDLVSGYLAWRRGDAALADSLFSALTRRNPRNAEAWYQLGETAFHYSAPRAKNVANASSPFAYVLLLDSLHWGARWHLLLLDASGLESAQIEARVKALERGIPNSSAAIELGLFAADERTAEGKQLILAAPGMALYDAAWRRAAFRGDLSGAEQMLRVALSPQRTPFERGMAATAIGLIRLARGDATNGVRYLLRGSLADRTPGSLVIATQASLVYDIREGAAAPESLAHSLDQWRATARPVEADTLMVKRTGLYLASLVAARRGDAPRTRSLSDSLMLLATENVSPDVAAERLSAIARAYLNFRERRYRETLDELDRANTPVWLGLAASDPFAAGSFERLLRGQTLQQLGRHAEAIAWFRTFEKGTLFDLAFLPAALRGEAASHRTLGERGAAEELDHRLAALMQTADSADKRH